MTLPGKIVCVAGALFLGGLAGCAYDEVSLLYPNGVSVYNFVSKEKPVQIIAFENGMPPDIHDTSIDGMPPQLYKKTLQNDVPIRRDAEGKIVALNYYWSERHDIVFRYQGDQYAMPLSNSQLRHIFGRPKSVDRRAKPN